MTRLELHQYKKNLSSSGCKLTLAFAVLVTFGTSFAWAQLAPNQTNGFGNNRLVTFTYLQNFDVLISRSWTWTSTTSRLNLILMKCRRRSARR
jgi:hypothetical protein